MLLSRVHSTMVKREKGSGRIWGLAGGDFGTSELDLWRRVFTITPLFIIVISLPLPRLLIHVHIFHSCNQSLLLHAKRRFLMTNNCVALRDVVHGRPTLSPSCLFSFANPFRNVFCGGACAFPNRWNSSLTSVEPYRSLRLSSRKSLLASGFPNRKQSSSLKWP